MTSEAKQQFKMNLADFHEFTQVWSVLESMGYTGAVKPPIAQFIYCYSDGRISTDYFDVDGKHINHKNTAHGYFANHLAQEIQFVDLMNHYLVFAEAPAEAYQWVRLETGECIWNCRKDGKPSVKTAPSFEIEGDFLWRDIASQKGAESLNLTAEQKVAELESVIG